MAKMTRLATTVTARYYPASDLIDAFYLDGRLSGRREARAADITVDKEDRGFFFSVFSHAAAPGRDPAAEPAYEAPLRKLYNEIKSGRKSLDDEIGDLVNTAVSVTGRMKLQADNARTPFFAGVMVKDSEAFAITMGKGLAFLYRDDTLFPLTATDLRIDPINTQRQKVDNFYNYCAAKTATALCSNIAQLKMDDCIILCNREVYDALGQQELLRILYDAEDQCDAAGIVVTEAAAKLPGVPLQFMISFVETVTAQEKSGLFGFGRKNRQQSYNESEDDAIEVPISKAAPVTAPVPVPESEPEPLFFGNAATNPFVQPLAEQPVVPTGPQDPIHFQDDALAPFGEPVAETAPEVDEGGFVKTGFEESEPGNAYEEDFANPADSFYTENAADDTNIYAESGAAGQNAPRYIPEEPEEEEGEPLVFGDDNTPAPSYGTPQSAFVTPSAAPAAPAPAAPAPAPSAPSSAEPFEESSQEPQPSTSFFIPFESKAPEVPGSTNVDDIPDMPLYDAPTYSPPTYPTNSYTPKGYDNAGVYARGSYSVDEEDDGVRVDVPPRQAPAGRSYSYTPPQQTVPSYGSTRDARMQQGQQPQQGQRRNAQQASASYAARPNAPRQNTQDMFDQDQNFEYGAPDAAYKRNKIWVFGLIGLCVVCIIVLVVALTNSNNKKSEATTASTTPQSIALETTAATGTTASGAVTSDTAATSAVTSETASAVNPTTVAPIGQFFFSDQTGFRTWWDVFNYAYAINITSNSDPRIAAVISYNGLAADYTPQPGDSIYLPPTSALPAAAATT